MDDKRRYVHYLENKAATEAAKSPLKRAMNPMSYVQPGATNFWTGMEMKKGWSVAIGAGAIGLAALGSIAAEELEVGKRRQVKANAVDVGSMESMNYDAVSNGPRKDLGATGEIVFGLHNSRKGR